MKNRLLSSLILSGILCLSIAAEKGFAAAQIPKGIGVCIHSGSAAKDLDMLKAAGFTIVRTDLKWNEVERTKGQYDWSKADQMVNAYTSRGLIPYLILDYNNFAYGAKNELDGISNSDQIAGYTNFAKAAAARYKGKGIIWEIWNEPNLDVFWRPTPNATAYMNLMKSVVPAMRSADPNAIIVAPGVAFIANTFSFLEECAKQGLFGMVDAISVHPYKDAAPETGSVDYLYDTVRNLIARYNPSNPNLPIIAGEFGFSVTWGSVKNETTQAQYLTRQLIYHDHKNIPISMVYDFKNDGTDPNNNEHNFGIVRNDYSIKPAYTEIQKLIQNRSGMNFSKRLSSAANDYIFEYTGASGKTAAAWTTGTAHTVNIYGKSVNLTNMPVYVKDSATPAPSVPAAPTNLKVSSVAKGATSGKYFVNLSWTDSSNNETGFQVQSSSSATGNFQTVMNVAANATTASVDLGTNPTPGTYYYRVVAVNATGSSQPSNVVNAVIEQPAPTPTVPAAPTNLKVSSVAKGATTGKYFVNLNWTDSSNNETGFQVQSSSSATGNFQTVMSVAANATSASVDLGTNPTPGTYYYRVVAENATGSSQPSNVVNAVIEAPAPDPTATIPSQPVSLKTTGITKDASTGNYFVNLSWTDRSRNEKAFEIQSSTSPTGEFKTVLVSGASSISNKVNLGSNPTPGTYYYRVVAVNDAGVSQPTNVISVVVESANAVPSAPTNLLTTRTVSVLDNKPAVFLKWNDCSQNEDGFNVYFATSQTGPFTKAGAIDKDQSAAVHMLNNKGTYYYKITAYNSVGESAESGITTVVIN